MRLLRINFRVHRAGLATNRLPFVIVFKCTALFSIIIAALDCVVSFQVARLFITCLRSVYHLCEVNCLILKLILIVTFLVANLTTCLPDHAEFAIDMT